MGEVHSIYQKIKLDKLQGQALRPLTLEYANGMFESLLEANVNAYSNVSFSRDRRLQNLLAPNLSSPVYASTPFVSSWRVILTGNSPGELLEHNYLTENLCPENAIGNTSWIKPGKMVREMTLSTPGGNEYVDFAVAHKLQYILYDGGWYGDVITDGIFPDKANPWEVKIGNIKDHPGLDIKKVIRYATEMGIGVFLYLDRRIAERCLDELLPIYNSKGLSPMAQDYDML